jgi:tetratricopeptide (TPR) repeat protein
MTHNNLGVLLQDTGRAAEAEKAFRQALQLMSDWWPSIPRCPSTQELAIRARRVGHRSTRGNNLPGLQLYEQLGRAAISHPVATGRAAEAEKAYRQALQLYERLVAEHPQVPQYRQELAMARTTTWACC